MPFWEDFGRQNTIERPASRAKERFRLLEKIYLLRHAMSTWLEKDSDEHAYFLSIHKVLRQ